MSGFAELDVPVGERVIRVVRHGTSGPSVVFEAGGDCASDEWAGVQTLLPTFTTWAYDRAGLGSSTPNGDWSLQASVADLEAWTSQLELRQPFVLVGHSMGCHVVRAFQEQNPSRVAALILVDARPPGFERRVLAQGIDLPMPPDDSAIVREFDAADAVVAALGRPDSIPVTVVRAETFDGVPQHLDADALRQIAEMWREEQDKLAAQMGLGEAIVVPDTGHMIPLEKPEAVAALVIAATTT